MAVANAQLTRPQEPPASTMAVASPRHEKGSKAPRVSPMLASRAPSNPKKAPTFAGKLTLCQRLPQVCRIRHRPAIKPPSIRWPHVLHVQLQALLLVPLGGLDSVDDVHPIPQVSSPAPQPEADGIPHCPAVGQQQS